MPQSSPSHPLDGIGLSFEGFKSYEASSGTISLAPINVIIGRNNSGKSALIQLVTMLSETAWDLSVYRNRNCDFSLSVYQAATEEEIRQVFKKGWSGGGIPGDHFELGKRFIGKQFRRNYNRTKSKATEIIFEKIQEGHQLGRATEINKRLEELGSILHWPFEVRVVRISAERSVQREPRSEERTLSSQGGGVTNLVRAFINSIDLPREEVEIIMLKDLNEIYSSDNNFDHIRCGEDEKIGLWEIYLGEQRKGDIPLSQSGSSLQSIFLIICYLRLVPRLDKIEWKRIVFAVEEPENNLHPALLRRLLGWLSRLRDELHFTLILTSHSPIAIDWASKRNDSQILHVRKVGGSTTIGTAVAYEHRRDILDDLDIRASDLLQANGIIWVEGPSDRTYINKWIELASEGRLQEGVHYAVMFYGGKLLSHLEALPSNIEESELISLLYLNRNVSLLMDSDRRIGGGTTKSGRKRRPRMNINATKQRLRDEIQSMNGHVWITEGREVENYLPHPTIERTLNKKVAPLDRYDHLVDSKTFDLFKGDKVQIAKLMCANMILSDINNHLDLYERTRELCDMIRIWNSNEFQNAMHNNSEDSSYR